MAELKEVAKIYVTPEGRVVVTRQDGDMYAYVNPYPQVGSASAADCDFKFGASTVPSGILTATLAHGLASQPSMIALTVHAGSNAHILLMDANATYIRVCLSVTQAFPTPFSWFAGVDA